MSFSQTSSLSLSLLSWTLLEIIRTIQSNENNKHRNEIYDHKLAQQYQCMLKILTYVNMPCLNRPREMYFAYVLTYLLSSCSARVGPHDVVFRLVLFYQYFSERQILYDERLQAIMSLATGLVVQKYYLHTQQLCCTLQESFPSIFQSVVAKLLLPTYIVLFCQFSRFLQRFQ